MPCVDLPPIIGDLHAKSTQVCAPMKEQVVGHLCPLVSGKMDEEQVQVANKSPVLHRDVVDTFVIMKPMVGGQSHLVYGTCYENANGAPCVVAKYLQ